MEKLYSVNLEMEFFTRAETEDEAIENFISFVENNDVDEYGRDWKDLLHAQIEEF